MDSKISILQMFKLETTLLALKKKKKEEKLITEYMILERMIMQVGECQVTDVGW